MARAGANGGPPAVCVYAGSSPGADPAFAEAAAALGRTVAGRGLELVYGGGAVGLMGVVANAAMSAGGRVTGIIPRALEEREIGHREVTDLVVVETMHERKALMAQRSGCFVALPGGIGTPAPPSRMRCSTPSHGGAPATTTSGSTGWAAPRWNLASGRRMPEPASIDLRGAPPVA